MNRLINRKKKILHTKEEILNNGYIVWAEDKKEEVEDMSDIRKVKKGALCISNVHTSVNCFLSLVGKYGYFANDLQSLREAVTNSKVNLKTVYSKLDGIHLEKYERRYSCAEGNFALFYPLDDTENKYRY